jgi:hypothetical protein
MSTLGWVVTRHRDVPRAILVLWEILDDLQLIKRAVVQTDAPL